MQICWCVPLPAHILEPYTTKRISRSESGAATGPTQLRLNMDLPSRCVLRTATSMRPTMTILTRSNGSVVAPLRAERILDYPGKVTLGTAAECVKFAWDWSKEGSSASYFACANPHSLETARNDPEFVRALEEADLVIPDGIGVVLASRILGGALRHRVTGPDMFVGLLDLGNREGGMSVFFLGSTQANLSVLCDRVRKEFPQVEIAGAHSPPFKPTFDPEDNDEIVGRVNRSGANVLWVGLTAPKQEKWVHQNRHRLKSVRMIGPIGAVFDYYTGKVRRPGPVVRRLGLEWAVRQSREPRRLWRRLLVTQPRFGLRVVSHAIRPPERR